MTIAKNIFVLFVLIISILLISGCSGSKSVATDMLTQSGMISQLSKSVGMTSSQTEAGLGAMMMLSKNKLSADDFSKLSKSIPGGANNLINKATSLGVTSGSIGTANDIVNALDKLGVSPLTAAKFVPEVLNLSKTLGGGAFGLLSKVF
jgi:outer membrane murein-binding lipoprotein Lpp